MTSDHAGLGRKQGGHPGHRQHGDIGQGEEAFEPGQQRQTHDGITHPVGGAHQEPPHLFRVPGKPARDLQLGKALPDLEEAGAALGAGELVPWTQDSSTGIVKHFFQIR